MNILRKPGGRKYSNNSDRGRISPDGQHQQAFEMLRKYADMSVGMRNAVFIQGILVLSGSGFLLSRGLYLWSIIASGFCLLMAILLNIMHVHFNNYFFSVRTFIEALENEFLVNKKLSYVRFVEHERDVRASVPLIGWLRLFGSFFLIGMGSAIMMLFAAAIWTRGDGLDPQITGKLEAEGHECCQRQCGDQIRETVRYVQTKCSGMVNNDVRYIKSSDKKK